MGKKRKQKSVESERESRDVPVGLVGTLLVLCSVLLFVPALEGPWLLDDLWLIQTNDKIHSFSQAGRWFTEGFWDMGSLDPAEVSLNYYRPFTQVTYALDWAVGGGSTIPFHFSNLLFAAVANTLVLVTLLRWFSGKPVLAFLGTALFCFHPAKAESIAWISGRTDLLALSGCLLALLGFSLRRASRLGNDRRRLGVALEVLGTGLAYFSKELAVVLPLLYLFELYFLPTDEEVTSAQGAHLQRLKKVLPQLVVALSYLLLRSWFYPLKPAGTPVLGLVEHAALVLSTLGHYAEILVWPRNLALKGVSTSEAQAKTAYILLGGLVVCVFLVMVWRSWRRRPRLAYTLLLFAGLLAPVSNLVPMGTTIQLSPRFLYAPSLAWSALVLLLLEELKSLPQSEGTRQETRVRSSPFRGRHGLGVGVLLVVLSVLGASSVSRASDFSSEQKFWSYELAWQPSDPSVILSKVLAEAEVGQLRLAERRLACGYAQSVKMGDPLAVTKYLQAAIEIPYRRTQDRDQVRLARLAQEIDTILHLAPGREVRAGEILLQGVPLELMIVNQLHMELLFRKAEVLARQNSPLAVEAAQLALDHCSLCAKEARRAAIVALRVGDDASALKWAAAVGAGGAAQDFRTRLRQVHELSSRAQGDPRRASEALMDRDLTLGNHEQVVQRLLAQDDLVSGASKERLVAYAEAAYLAGYPELAAKWLQSLGEETSMALLYELAQRVTWRQATDSSESRPFVPGTCAFASETDKRPLQP